MRLFWTTAFGLIGLLAALGCGVDTGEEDAPMVGTGILAAPAPFLPDGTTPEDHVEVAPGVFLLGSAMDSGEVGYVQLDQETLEQVLGGAPADGVAKNGDALNCINRDGDGFYEETSRHSLFGGDPAWSGSLTVISAYHVEPGLTLDVDLVRARVTAEAPGLVGVAETYGIIRVHGFYVGYIHDYLSPGEVAAAEGYLTLACPQGAALDVEVKTFHTLWDGEEALYVTEHMAANVPCCP